MARRQGDRLKYAANLIAVGALLYLGSTALLRWVAERLFGLFHASATLENPIAVPEWLLGICNLILPAAGLILAFGVIWWAVRNSPMRLKISLYLPHRAELWLFVPVFLGVNLVCSLGTSLLQRFLETYTGYQVPAGVQLPESGFATLLYYIGICVVPAIFEELFVRGAVQKLLAHWGAWFSIVVSSVLFALLHQDIAQMPTWCGAETARSLGRLVLYCCFFRTFCAFTSGHCANAVYFCSIDSDGARSLLHRVLGCGYGCAFGQQYNVLLLFICHSETGRRFGFCTDWVLNDDFCGSSCRLRGGDSSTWSDAFV